MSFVMWTLLCDYFNFTLNPQNSFIISKQVDVENETVYFYMDKIDKGVYALHLFVQCEKSKMGFTLDSTLTTVAAKLEAVFGKFALQSNRDFNVFILLCVDSDIMFLEYYSNIKLLDEKHIKHYKGFIPLTRPLQNLERQYEFSLDILKLLWQLINGVYSNSLIEDLHRWDLCTRRHQKYIHEQLVYLVRNNPGRHIKN